MTKKIIVNETVPSSVVVTQENGEHVSVTQKPVSDSTVAGTRAEVIETQTTGPQGNVGTAFKYIGDTEPDTTGWEINDFWYDTSTES